MTHKFPVNTNTKMSDQSQSYSVPLDVFMPTDSMEVHQLEVLVLPTNFKVFPQLCGKQISMFRKGKQNSLTGMSHLKVKGLKKIDSGEQNILIAKDNKK